MQVLTNAILHMLCNCVFCVFVHNVKGYDSFCFKKQAFEINRNLGNIIPDINETVDLFQSIFL